MKRTANFLYCYILLFLLLHRLPFWWQHQDFICGDQATGLKMAQLWLSGMRPYIDFFEVNPPLIIYINAIPIMLSEWLHIAPAAAFKVFIEALSISSVAGAGFFFLQNRTHAMRNYFWPLLIGAAALCQNIFFDYGQREHLFILLYFPFLVLRLLRFSQGKVSALPALVVGILAGAGVCLKPQFFATAMAVEMTMYLSNRAGKIKASGRRPSPEIVGLLAVCGAFVIHLLCLSEAARERLFGLDLTAYMLGKSFFATSFLYSVAGMPVFFYPFVALCLAIPLAFMRMEKCVWIRPVLVFTLVSLLSFLQIGLNWTYRGLPMQAGSFMLIALGFASFTVKKKIQNALLAAFAVALTFFPGVWANQDFSTQSVENFMRPARALAAHMMANSGPDDAVLCIGVGLRPTYPAQLIANRKPGSRYLYGMMLPIAYECRKYDDKKFGALEDKIVDEYGEDIAKRRPRLIYIEGFFMEPFLERHKFAERFMGKYEFMGQCDSAFWKVYRLRE